MSKQVEREKPGKEYRLFGDSTRYVRTRWLNAITSYEGRVKFHGRKLSPGPALNAIVLSWLSMPKGEREAFLAKGVRAFERHTDTEGAEAAGEGEKSPAAK